MHTCDNIVTKFSYAEQLADCKTTAYWLARRGWSEAAGGNMSIRVNALTALQEDEHIKLPIEVPHIAGQVILLSGSGTRARDIGVDAEPHMGLYKIADDGQHYGWIAGNQYPSMELPAHFAIHNALEKHRPGDKAILHTHPASLIALCHVPGFDNSKTISDTILSLQSEARLILPEGIGFVEHELPGSLKLGLRSAEQLTRHHLVLWQYHGLLATGETLAGAFDKLEVFEKSAQVYWKLRAAGIDSIGIPETQTRYTLEAFNRLHRYLEE